MSHPQGPGVCEPHLTQCLPPGPGDAAEPRAAMEGAVRGQPQSVACPLPGAAGPRAGAALPLGPPDAHPAGHGEALAAPAALRAPAALLWALGAAALRLEPAAPCAPALRRAPRVLAPGGRLCALVVAPPCPQPLRRRLGLGLGAGLARLRPSRPTPCPFPSQPPRPLGEYGSPRSRHGSGSYGPEPAEARSASQLEPDRRSLPRTPSACGYLAPKGARGGLGRGCGLAFSRKVGG